MKVLHLLDTSLPDISGYTTRAHYLLSHQRKAGIEPVVLTSERFRGGNGQRLETVADIRHYRSVRKNGRIRKVPFMAQVDEIRSLSKRVAEVAAKEGVDILHAHSPSLTGAACLPFCRRHRLPFVYEIRAFWEDAAVDRGAIAEDSLVYRLRRRHETRVAAGADAVIAICGGLGKDLEARGIGREKLHIVPNGVDPERFQPLSTDMPLKTEIGCRDQTVIGFIGSFFHFEGLQDLIRAMPMIAAVNPDVRLLLVGGGQVDQQLRRLAQDAGQEDRILFAGRVPHEQVERYYSIIDVLVYPRISRRITELVTPLKPLEAMAMGKTVLMSDVGGLRELADADGVAAFFRAGDVRDLSEKCLALCGNRQQREKLGAAARRHVRENWSWSARANKDIDLYHQLLESMPARRGRRFRGTANR